MEGIRPNAPPPITATPSAETPAAPQAQASKPAGFSQSDGFDPNSQASARSDLVIGQFAKVDATMAGSYRAVGWHRLKMELISLMKPSS